MSRPIRHLPILSAVGLLGVLAVLPVVGQVRFQQAGPGVAPKAELFHISRAGKANASETREKLIELYNLVAAAYDDDIKVQRQRQQQVFAGQRVRVVQVLGEADDHGQLYICAYGGQASVFSIGGERLRAGGLSPPLIIAEAGQHTTTVTRTVTERRTIIREREAPAGGGAMSSDGEVATFFGIPIFEEDEPAAAPKLEPEVIEVQEQREVQEEEVFPKYTADLSTDLLEGGLPFMSTDLFVSLSKNGEVFYGTLPEERRCQDCRGFGKMQDLRGPGVRNPDGKVPCGDCGGSGRRDWMVTYSILW